MDQRYIVALELSGSQIKGAIATTAPSPYAPMAAPTVETVVYEDQVNCVQYGRVHNLVDAAKSTTAVIDRLNASLHGGKINSAYVALEGRSFGSMAVTAELSLSAEAEINEDILNHLYNRVGEKIPTNKAIAVILPRKYYVNNQLSQNPVGVVGKNIKGEFTVVTYDATNRRNLEMLFDKRVNLQVKDYIIAPLAIADLVLSEGDKQIGCALVDIGAQTTTVSIYKDRALQYLATLPLGSQNITRDLAYGLKATEEEAERIKISQGYAVQTSAPSSSDEININCYVQARAAEIAANIIAQIEYAGYKPSDIAAGFVLTGRGSKLKNFARLLQEQSRMNVKFATLPSNIKIADIGITPTDYTSLIAIISKAASKADSVGCISFPQEEDKKEKAVVETSFDPFGIDEDDDSWRLDDDEEDIKQEKEKKSKKQELSTTDDDNDSSNTILERVRKRMKNIFNIDSEEGDTNLDDEYGK